MADIEHHQGGIPENSGHSRKKLIEAEEILLAIRSGRVDALVVSGPQGDQVYTLKGADHTYRVLIETMTEGAIILSEDGTILYCNGRFAEMVQRTMEHVMGGSMRDFIQASEKDQFTEVLNRASTENIRVEMGIAASSGELIPALLSMRSLSVEEKRLVCMVLTDLTHQKRTEQKLKAYAEAFNRKNIELRHRAEQLSRLSSELTLSEQRERRRLAEILHDHLQQLLVVARLGLETLCGQIAPEQRRAVERVVGLLRESIDMSRSLTVELCPPALFEGGLVKALEWLSRWMKEKHAFEVDLETDTADPLGREPMIVLLFESVRELLFNVAKHARVNSARVQLIHSDKKFLKIVVTDRGMGFEAKRLWENTGPQEGGFGLFSIRERLSLLGGRVEVTSAPGEGTMVALTAPLEKLRPVEPKSKVTPHSPMTIDNSKPRTGRKARKRTRLMLVDDHAVMRDALSTLMEKYSDIETIGEASDGEEAVHKARELRPDVILMDISMPKMNGIQATRAIHQEFPNIRIIGLSMFDATDQAASMLKAGAVAYVSKTGGADALIEAIRNRVSS